MKRIIHPSVAALAAAVIALGTASAAVAQPNPAPATAANMTAISDVAFVQQFTMANTTEIREARYIVRHTQSPLVRAFAQHMIDDHSTAAVKLREVAREVSPAMNVSATAMTPGQQLQFANLRALSEPQLDQAYMRDQIGDHNDAIMLLDYEAQNGTAPSLRDFASATRPVVLGHLGMVEAYESSGGRTTEVGAAGVIFPGVMPGAADPNTARNGTPSNNAGAMGNGSTNGSANGSGGTREGNTTSNPNSAGAPANSAPQQNATPIPAASPRD